MADPKPPDPKPLQNDPTLTMEINLVGQSPHVFAYRFWHRQPGQNTWTVFADGHTADNVPDFFSSGPFPDGTQVAYWVGIAGNKKSQYKFLVTFAQSGKLVVGGADEVRGKTSDKGGAVHEQPFILI